MLHAYCNYIENYCNKSISAQHICSIYDESLEDFIAKNRGTLIIWSNNCKIVKVYLNWYQYSSYGMIGKILINDTWLPHNRAGVFIPDLLMYKHGLIGKIALCIISIFIISSVLSENNTKHKFDWKCYS